MKRSKILLGITTGLLAVVAVGAAKLHKFTHTKSGFFGTRANTCNRLSAAWFTDGSTQASTKLVLNGPTYLVYTAGGVTNPAPEACTSIIGNHELYLNHGSTD